MNRIILNVLTCVVILCFMCSIAIIWVLMLYRILTGNTETLQIINDYITHHKKTKMNLNDLLNLVYLIMAILLPALIVFVRIVTI